jgi:PEGA domain-containing protein
MRRASIALVVALSLTAGSVSAAPPAPAPSASDLAEAKHLFEQGLKLYGEGSYRQALAAFLKANQIAPRASIQRNIAQCQRDLHDFAAAYVAYQSLLARWGSTMSAADRRPVERAIEELALLTGTVRVDVADAGAAVAVDGQDAGTTPLAAPVRVNLGPHTVTVSKAGFETIKVDAKLNGGDQVVVSGPLRPETDTGHIAVNAPPGANVDVYLDGKDVGPAPWSGDVQSGGHTIEARGSGQYAAPKLVDVQRHASLEMTLDLQSASGRVQVDTHTTDATIAIDGTIVGRGVWEGTLPAGQHELSVEAPGKTAYRSGLLVHPGETVVEDARLTPEGLVSYKGLYSGLAIFGFAAPTGATNAVASNCPTEPPAVAAGQAPNPCTASSPLGAGLIIRVGYAFGWIAVEGVALGSYDYSTGSVTYLNKTVGDAHEGIPRNEDYGFHRFGGGGAVGVRVASKDPHVRATGAVYGGFVNMGNIYKRSSSSTTAVPPQSEDFTADNVSYTAALLMFDAGVLIGWANGPKAHVGVLTMIQFIGDPVNANPSPTVRHLGNSNEVLGTPPLQVAQGTSVFIGPVLGVDFGL